MACKECGKTNCTCGKDRCSSPAAIQINNTETVLFRKVLIPASMGDETTNPPVPGAFCNALVVYEATNAVYLYSSDGVPTRIDGMGDTREIWEAIHDEEDARRDADDAIWVEIEAIEASSDVVDVVGTKAELDNYDTSKLKDNDIIKVLQDETRDDAITYYRWNGTAFVYVGAEGPYYTASETDTLLAGKQNALTAGTNITITNDVISATAAPQEQADWNQTDAAAVDYIKNKPAINDGTLIINQNGVQVGVFSANQANTTTVDLTGGSGGAYTAGTGIDITGTVISVDTAVVAEVSDIPTKTSDLLNDGSDGTSTYVEANSLAAVATSGSYNDLSNKPTIPAAQVNSDWNAASGVAQILNKPTLATVATSGDYNDLLNLPTIPVTNNISSTDWNALWQ